jgi:hypothetical protein
VPGKQTCCWMRSFRRIARPVEKSSERLHCFWADLRHRRWQPPHESGKARLLFDGRLASESPRSDHCIVVKVIQRFVRSTRCQRATHRSRLRVDGDPAPASVSGDESEFVTAARAPGRALAGPQTRCTAQCCKWGACRGLNASGATLGPSGASGP